MLPLVSPSDDAWEAGAPAEDPHAIGKCMKEVLECRKELGDKTPQKEKQPKTLRESRASACTLRENG